MNGPVGPVGRAASQGAADRAQRSQEYRDAVKEYAAIRELRKDDPAAAGAREQRFESGCSAPPRGRTLTVHLSEPEDGWITATIAEEPAAISQGRTEQDALENVVAALRDLEETP